MTYPNQPGPYGRPAPHGQPASCGQPASYGQPAAHGHPAQYGHPGYQQIYPGYSAFGSEPPRRANPAAGILLLIGVLVGLGACFIPYNVVSPATYGGGSADMPLIAAITQFPHMVEAANVTNHGWRYVLSGLSIIVLALGTVFCLVAGLVMFAGARRRHAGAASTGLVGATIMLAAPIMLVIATDGHVVDFLDLTTVLAMAAWLPALLGGFVGFTR